MINGIRAALQCKISNYKKYKKLDKKRITTCYGIPVLLRNSRFLPVIYFLSLILFSPLVHAGFGFSAPADSVNGGITLSYVNNDRYYVFFEEVNGSASTVIHEDTNYQSSGSFSVTKPNGTYTFRIRRCDYYTGGWPGNCTTTANKTVVVGIVSFSVPSSDNDGTFTLSYNYNSKYFVYFQENISGTWTSIHEDNNQYSGSYNVTKSSGTYSYRLKRCDRVTNNLPGSCVYTSSKSIVITLPFLPSQAPSITENPTRDGSIVVNFFGHGTSNRLYWQKDGQNVGNGPSLGQGNQAATIGLPGNAVYSVYVRGCIGSDCNNSPTTQVTSVKTPGTPTSITLPASSGCDGMYPVSWDTSTGGNRYYMEQRSRPIGGAWSGWSSSPNGNELTSVPYWSVGMPNGRDYQFRVRARYLLNGHYSNYSGRKESVIITKPACAQPSAPSVSESPKSTDGSYSVSFVGTAANNQLIERKNDDPNSEQVLSTTVNSSNTGSVSVTRENGKYEYYVKSCAANSPCVTSAVSKTAVVKTPGTPGSINFSPTALNCNSSFNVNWGAAAGGNRYQIQERSRTIGGTWGGWETLSSTHGSATYSRPASDTNIGKEYQYQVRARYTADGQWSSYGGWRSSGIVTRPMCEAIAPMFSQNPLVEGAVTVNYFGHGSSNTLHWRLMGGDQNSELAIAQGNHSASVGNLINGQYEFYVRGCVETYCINSPTSTLTVAGTLAPISGDPLETVADPTSSPLLGYLYNGSVEGDYSVGEDGSFNYSVPIEVSPGIQGVQPQLSLNYNSSQRNGIVGWGWSLDGLSKVHRCKATVVQDGYASGVMPDDDYKYCFNGKRLIEIAPDEYRTEAESYLRIYNRGSYWEVVGRDGSVRRYGSDYSARELDGDSGVYAWHLDKFSDKWGNFYTVQYSNSEGFFKPVYIFYTSTADGGVVNKRVEFGYELRDDQIGGYAAGKSYHEFLRLAAIRMVVNSEVVWDYHLDYQESGIYHGKEYSDPVGTSRLARIRRCFGSEYICQSLIRFDWSERSLEQHIYRAIENADPGLATTASYFDIDNDGVTDEVDYLPQTTGEYEWERYKDGELTQHTSVVETSRQAIDLNGDGYKEVIQKNAHSSEGITVYPNQQAGDNASDRTIGTAALSGYHVPASQLTFNAVRLTKQKLLYFNDPRYWVDKSKYSYAIQYADMDGDGLLDLVRSLPSCPESGIYCEFLDPNNFPTYKETVENSQIGYSKEISVAFNTGSGWERDGGQVKFHVIYNERDNFKLEAKLQLIDVNNDGLTDVYLGAASRDNSLPNTLLINSGGTRSSLSLSESVTYEGQRYLADFNGDGIKDIAYFSNYLSRSPRSMMISLGNGAGFEEFKNAAPEGGEPSIFCSENQYERSKCSHTIVDFNGDGYDDLVEYGGCFGSGECFDELSENGKAPFIAQVWLSAGVTQSGAVTFAPPIEYRNRAILEQELGIDAPESRALNSRNRPYFHDYNNDGLLEDDIRLSHSLIPHRIEGVISQRQEVRVDYQNFAGTGIYLSTEGSSDTSASEFDTDFITQPEMTAKRFGVRELSVSTGTNEDNPTFNTATYQYSGARIHIAGYGNLGFSQKEVTSQNAGSNEYIRTVTDYHQLATNKYKLAGVPKRQRVYAYTQEHGEQLIGDTRNQWKLRFYPDDIDAGTYNSPHYFPYVYESSAKTWNLDGTELTTQLTQNHSVASHSCSQLDLDDIGTVLTVDADGADDTDYHADGVLLSSATASCDSTYPTAPGVVTPSRDNAVRINTVANEGIQTRGDAIGLVTSTTVGAGTGSSLGDAASALQEREVSMTYTSLGALETQTTEPGDPNQLITRYGYETWGAVKSIEETWADRADDGLPGTSRTTTITNVVNEDGSLTVTTTLPLLGSSSVKYDAVFGQPIEQTDFSNLTTETHYDEIGRAVRVDYPDGTSSTVDYHYCSDCFGYNDNDHWYVQTKTTGSPDTRTYYDRLNRPVGERNWALGGMTYTVQHYNVQGRVASVSQPFYITDIPQTTSYTYDLLGRGISTSHPDGSVESTQYSGFITTSTNAENQVQQRISNGAGWIIQSVDNDSNPVDFTYAPFGELKTTRVDNNETTKVEIFYDNAGRKARLSDPNTGTLDYTYNAFGLLVTETNAKNQTTAYTYDVLGRQRTRTDANSYTHQWIYDQNGQKGELTGLTGFTTEGLPYTETYTYTAYGKPETVTAAFEGKNYGVTHSYDDHGRPLATTYPTGYRVANIYDAKGFLTMVVNTGDNRPLWIADEANALGQVTRFTLGDGTTTERVYTEETGMVESIATTTRTNDTVMSQEYVFDHIGKLTERRDNLHGVVQNLCYDDMNRLTAARFNGCSASDADYSYNALGNITAKAGVGSYAYSQTGNAGPHAVTAANGLSYEYDAAGYLVRARNAANAIIRQVDWSAINKPTRIANNSHWTEIHYGPDTSRIKREDSTGRTTYYFGSLYEETTYGTEAHRVHTIGDFALYIEDAYTGEGYHEYLHRDHLGSVVAKTNDKTITDVERLAYDAWGSRRLLAWDGMEEGPDYQAVSVRGYTDHEHLDPVGLIHMNGRVYDPELGRFLSPDPYVQAPYNTQSYNRYSYVFNNPLSFTDPSGYFCSQYDKDGCGEYPGYNSAGNDGKCPVSSCMTVIGVGLSPSDYFLWGTYFAQQQQQQADQFNVYDFFKGAITQAWDNQQRNIHYAPMLDWDGAVLDPMTLADLCDCDYESELGDPTSDSEELGRKAAPLIEALLVGLAGKGGGKRPTTRKALDSDLKAKGYEFKGTSKVKGYTTYKGPDGKTVTIKPTGEVILTQKVWNAEGTQKFPQRQDYNGNPIPDQAHSTGHFVEPFFGPLMPN